MTGIEVLAGIASPLIRAVLVAAKSKLDEIPENRKEDATAAATYLEVADAAAAALEAESDELLLTAMRLPRSSHRTAEAEALLNRIDDLLLRDPLRRLISEMVGRLEACKAALEKDARRLGGHRKPSGEDQSLIDEIGSELARQLAYLRWLQTDQGIVKTRASAPWLHDLERLRELVDSEKYAEAGKRASEMLNEREPLSVERSRRIGTLAERLRTQFR
jgi:hypothetical protein